MSGCPRTGIWWTKAWKPTGTRGLHSVLRDKLNRPLRRTKDYCKSETKLRDSIVLVCLRLSLI